MKEIKEVPWFVKKVIASIAKLLQDLFLAAAYNFSPSSSIMNQVKTHLICLKTINRYPEDVYLLSSPKKVVLPNPELWGELFEFCPTFTTWNLSYSRTKE